MKKLLSAIGSFFLPFLYVRDLPVSVCADRIADGLFL